MPQYNYNAPVAVAYAHITNAGTNVVKGAPGQLFSININSGSSGSGLTLLDQVGSTVGTVDIGIVAIGTSDIVPLKLAYGPEGAGIKFNTGLVIVSTGTIDATIGYR
jgi:hypothetical protein